MEGADNMAYICNTESLKENRRVRSCSLALVTLLHVLPLPPPPSPVSLRCPFPSSLSFPPDVSGFLAEALLRYLFV